MSVWLSTENPVFFLQSALFPPFLFLSLQLSLLLVSILCSSLIICQPSKLCSVRLQCLESVQRVSFPAQMAAALLGAGSAMGITTALMVQMR